MNVFGNTAKEFFVNEDGFILSSEALLIGSITIVGLLVGFVRLRDSLIYELDDLAATFAFLDQSFEYTGVGHELNADVFTQGSLFTDSDDFSDPGSPGTFIQMNPVGLFPGAEGP